MRYNEQFYGKSILDGALYTKGEIEQMRRNWTAYVMSVLGRLDTSTADKQATRNNQDDSK